VFGVETLHRLHQADVAFLHQVAEVQSVTRVALGHVHDETEVCEHHAARSLEFAVVTEAAGQVSFFFQRQHGNLVDLLDVGVQAAGSRGDEKMAWYQFFAH